MFVFCMFQHLLYFIIRIVPSRKRLLQHVCDYYNTSATTYDSYTTTRSTKAHREVQRQAWIHTKKYTSSLRGKHGSNFGLPTKVLGVWAYKCTRPLVNAYQALRRGRKPLLGTHGNTRHTFHHQVIGEKASQSSPFGG